MATLGVVVQRFKQQSIHELSARTKTSGCCARRPLGFTVLFYFNINHLRPNIQIQILQTDLHIFPYRISWANLFVDQGFSHQVMILLTLTTFSLNIVWRKLTFFTLETSRVNWISLKVPALWLFNWNSSWPFDYLELCLDLPLAEIKPLLPVLFLQVMQANSFYHSHPYGNSELYQKIFKVLDQLGMADLKQTFQEHCIQVILFFLYNIIIKTQYSPSLFLNANISCESKQHLS